MTTTSALEYGTFLEMEGKSGRTYPARIYRDKSSTTTLPPRAIVCLSNSRYVNEKWQHDIKDIYDTASVEEALAHFRVRDDISHLILIPVNPEEKVDWDRIDDLRRQYIHK